MKKRIIALLLSLTLVFCFYGCGGDGDNEQSNAIPAGASQSPSQPIGEDSSDSENSSDSVDSSAEKSEDISDSASGDASESENSAPERAAVPDVLGQSEEDAKSAIEAAGFVFASTYEFSDSVEKGMVISLSSEVGEEFEKGVTITATVSRGAKGDLYQPLNYDTMKAVWISQYDMYNVYVLNGNQRDKTTYTKYIKQMMEKCKSIDLNTVIVQVRPFGDSFYPSEFYSPGYMATGSYYKDFTYDPFEIIIEQAHALNLSVQAWINPLRLMPSDKIVTVNKKYPIRQWFDDSSKKSTYLVNYNSRYYLNPAYEDVRNLIISGAREIVEKYDVDGLHMDDYFYPTTEESFDAVAYSELGNGKSLADFRTDNITMLVKGLYDAVKDVNPDVIYGISPAGDTTTVRTQDYLDINTILKKPGYIDYILPQIYFGFEHSTNPFDTASNRWIRMTTCDEVKVYIGITMEKAVKGANGEIDQWGGSEAGKNEWINAKDVLSRSIMYLQGKDGADGFSLFSYQLLFNPLSGAANNEYSAEYASFIPAIKNFSK